MSDLGPTTAPAPAPPPTTAGAGRPSNPRTKWYLLGGLVIVGGLGLYLVEKKKSSSSSSSSSSTPQYYELAPGTLSSGTSTGQSGNEAAQLQQVQQDLNTLQTQLGQNNPAVGGVTAGTPSYYAGSVNNAASTATY